MKIESLNPSLGSDFLAASRLACRNGARRVLFIILVFVAVARRGVLRRRDPQPRLAAFERAVLVGKVDAFAVLATLMTALRKRARAGGEVGLDRGVLLDPIGQRIFAVLDDTISSSLANRKGPINLIGTYALLAS